MATGPEPKKQPEPAQPEGDLAVVTRPKLERARRYRVIFYNDDYTTKWFVVDVLERFFHMTEANATAFMLVVHQTGRGVAGVYTRDIAETKVDEVHRYAKEWGMPLRLDIEPEDDGEA
jgi:ATP-dependent Clp protease adaptor protein ClpS